MWVTEPENKKRESKDQYPASLLRIWLCNNKGINYINLNEIQGRI